MLSRLVRVANVCLAVLLAAVALAIYWFAIRPLPKVSGDITAPITRPALVKRDARGVPHIEAASWQDAIFLQGYVTAQDRLWQMDGLRRFGAGDLSEVFGAGTLPLDEHSRRMRMRAIAESAIGRLSPQERSVLTEYARGVNYFIDTHRGNYSLEFSLPGHSYNPRPWTMTDSVLVGLVMFRNLTDSSVFELDKWTLLAASGDSAKLRLLFPVIQGGRISPGSNAWAVSAAHAADGQPMLANDPHLEYQIPGTWHLVHLKAPDLDVSGAALPGIPCVITGHNAQIAWGVTNLSTDVLDLYQEQLDERTGRYLYQGKLEQAQLDRQFIPVKGSAKPWQVDIWITRHGPVVFRAKSSYTMRWSAADGFGFPFLAVDEAQNWDQFRAALHSFWGAAQNFVYADRAGNIGYQAAGRVPIRPNFDGDIPLDGASGQFEWNGYIPYEQMPSEYNPPSGIVATANQNPFPLNYPYRITASFADKYRVTQIRALLSAKAKLTVDDMLAVQKDVYSAYDHFLAQQVIAASQKHTERDPLVRDGIQILRGWDGQMDKSSPAPVMTELLSKHLGISLELCSPPKFTNKKGEAIMAAPRILPRPQIIERMLRDHPSGWVPKDDWDTWLLSNFSAAMQEGRHRLGVPVSDWRWGSLQRWHFEHPVGKQLPLLDRFFNIGPVEMSGSGTTVKQTTTALGPSERMVVDLGDLDKSVQNLVTGESGFVASAHYKDEWPAYYEGKSFPMQFNKIDAKEILRVTPGR